MTGGQERTLWWVASDWQKSHTNCLPCKPAHALTACPRRLSTSSWSSAGPRPLVLLLRATFGFLPIPLAAPQASGRPPLRTGVLSWLLWAMGHGPWGHASDRGRLDARYQAPHKMFQFLFISPCHDGRNAQRQAAPVAKRRSLLCAAIAPGTDEVDGQSTASTFTHFACLLILAHVSRCSGHLALSPRASTLWLLIAIKSAMLGGAALEGWAG
ncbi:hypothetical protein BKA66DRAFT_441693 [Pyrenochaeta sp. MPI-SDFR-AT-0127]|nr:hypothetical protein BKA66DRAFT_441693 [Pyrenochaeta sp. MPI-SDFR-AT-0127]